MNKLIILFFIPFLIVPGIFIFGGALMLSDSMSLLDEGIKVEGKVVEIVSKGSSSSSPIYYPVAQYTSEAGEVVTKELDYGSNPASYSVGEPISLVYRKEAPDKVYINSSFWSYFFPGLFITIGIIFELIVAVIFIRFLKKDKNEVAGSYPNSTKEETPIYSKDKDDNKGNPFLMK